MRTRWLPLVVSFALLSSCTSTKEPSASAWSAPQWIAPALQWNAPASVTSRDQIAFVWTGFDREHVHQDARLANTNTLRPPVILPLPPTHPMDQRLVPGADGSFHLFWLDAGPNGEGNHLFSALLTPELQIERGPVDLSNAPTYQFAVTDDGRGGAIAVWSQGQPAEPDLWAVEIDATGLPRQPANIASNSPQPALTRTPIGTVQVFQESEGRLWIATWEGSNAPVDWRALTATVGRRAGDRLDSLWAAPCGRYICVGWNITRQDDTAESWLASGAANASSWNAPHRVDGVTWLTPETGADFDPDSLMAAAQIDGGLTLLSVREGNVIRQEIAIEGVSLSGSPAVTRLGDALVLSWAEVGTDYANLWMSQKNIPFGGD
ncbi:MAG: hypothetical protein U0452_11745 [Anaerolineae bacterium]